LLADVPTNNYTENVLWANAMTGETIAQSSYAPSTAAGICPTSTTWPAHRWATDSIFTSGNAGDQLNNDRVAIKTGRRLTEEVDLAI
jgi:hypothetical protein